MLFSHQSCLKIPQLSKLAAVLPVETKSTEPSKRLFKYKLPVCGEANEISVFLSFLAVISQPIIYYFYLADSQYKKDHGLRKNEDIKYWSPLTHSN
jgi:hypothetical protein